MWHAVGAELLYEDVVFRRIGQIPAFIRTLDTSTWISSDLVKKITISAYVPRRYGRSCSEHLQRIFSRCCHIYKFALASPTVLPDVVTLPIHNVHITTLEVNDTFKYQSLLPVLSQVCDTLLSLSFYPNKSGDLHTALHFPHLKSLVCVTWELESAQALTVISSAWSLPSLESLTFDMGTHCGRPPINYTIYTQMIHTFCLTHGKRLRFLLVGPGHQFSTPRMQEIVDACPTLEHLVMKLDVSELSIAHRNIKWIDLWSYESPYWFKGNYPWEMTFFYQTRDVDDAPALQGVRTLMHGLSMMLDVLRISPSWTADKNIFSIQYPGLDIRFEQGFLYDFSPIRKNGGDAAGHDKDSDCSGFDSSGDESDDEKYESDDGEYENDDEEYVAESDETDSSSFISDTTSVSSGSLDDDMYLPEFSDSDGDLDSDARIL
jgi:hypothetical protein